MSLEEFVHELERPPAGSSGLGGREQFLREFIEWKKKVPKKQKKGEEFVEVPDVDTKTSLANPQAFAILETLTKYVESEFGTEAADLLKDFDLRFKVDMMAKDGQAMQNLKEVLIGLDKAHAEEQKSLLDKISKM